MMTRRTPRPSSGLISFLLFLCTTLLLIAIVLIVTMTRDGVEQTEEILEEKLRNLTLELHSTIDQLSQEDSSMNDSMTNIETSLKALRTPEVMWRINDIEKGVKRLLTQEMTGYLATDIQRILGTALRLLEGARNPNGTVQDPLCSKGWEHFGLSCYFLSQRMRPWKISEADCRRSGAHLIVLNTKEEMDFLKTMSNGVETWVGLTGDHKWVDGTPYDTTPNFWVPSEPDEDDGVIFDYEDDEFCAYSLEGTLHSSLCDRGKTYVCEKKTV